jgi:hypothetical protein
MKKPSFRPSPAMIVACVALFVALGGTATAVTYVVSSNSQIGPGTVSGHNPPSGKHGNIISGSVNGTDLAPNSVGSSEIAANAVGASKVANESLTLSDIAGTASNGSISLSGIPNGRCTQVTLNVGGAQVGDSPIVTTRAAIQNGMVLYPNRVASAGHVEVNACNFTGTSMTPISNFPIRVITLR